MSNQTDISHAILEEFAVVLYSPYRLSASNKRLASRSGRSNAVGDP